MAAFIIILALVIYGCIIYYILDKKDQNRKTDSWGKQMKGLFEEIKSIDPEYEPKSKTAAPPDWYSFSPPTPPKTPAGIDTRVSIKPSTTSAFAQTPAAQPQQNAYGPSFPQKTVNVQTNTAMPTRSESVQKILAQKELEINNALKAQTSQAATELGALLQTVSQKPEKKVPPRTLPINSCTVEELATLPGISPEKAQEIVALRKKVVYFLSFEDFVSRAKIEPEVAQQIKPYVTFLTQIAILQG